MQPVNGTLPPGVATTPGHVVRPGRRPRLRLHTKLMLLLVGFVVVPPLLIAWLLGGALLDKLEADAQTDNRETAQLAATLAAAHTDRAREALLGVAADVRSAVLRGEGMSVGERLRAATLTDPDLTIVNLFDAEGRFIASSAGLGVPLGADYSEAPVVRLGMASSGWVMGDAALGVFSGLPVAHHALPIRDNDGVLRGLLTAGLSLERLGTALGAVHVGNSGYVIMVGRDGQILSHPDRERLLQDASSLEPPVPGAGPAAWPANGQVDRLLVGYAPVPGTGWQVIALRPLTDVLEPLQQLALRLIALVGLVLVGALLVAALAANRFVRPLESLGRGVERLAAGDFSRPLMVRTGDELEEVAERFNHMAQRLDEQRQVQEQMYQAERLRALGRLAAGVAHDFNNVLALIALRAETLADGVRAGRVATAEVEQALLAIQRAALDGAQTVRRIQLFGRQRQDAAADAVDLDQLCLDTVELTRGRWREQSQVASAGIRVVLELGAPPAAHGRTAELREVLTNLIINAADAMPHGGVITLRTETQDGWVCLAVCDTGVGMAPDVQRRIFEPFYTTKGEGGTGLGLAVSYGIVQAYHGEIAVESAPGAGSAFTIRLPRAEAARPEPAPAPPMAARPARVLVLEDDPAIAELLAAILERDGHEVVLAGDGHEGMELLDEGAFAVVLSDVAMPELSGWDVARAVHAREPDTPVVFVSGWGETLDPDRLAAHGVRSVVRKPFCVADVRAAIASALSA